MALSRFFILTSIDKSSLYIKTNRHKDGHSLIKYLDKSNATLKQITKETNRNPISFSIGFFVSAQEVDEKSISSNYNKLWEIL